jgi:hypothetical protein
MDRIAHFIWTDIPAEDEDAFNAWYTDEHMPDRVHRIPGFIRGRRFRATTGGPRYLAYYEMADRDVYWSPAYLALRGEPDPKSRHFVARFRNALRSTATIAIEYGSDEGPVIGVTGVTGGPVTRIRLCRTDRDLVDGNARRMADHTRSKLRPSDRVPDFVLTVEGEEVDAVSRTLRDLIGRFGPEARTDASAVMTFMSGCVPPAGC